MTAQAIIYILLFVVSGIHSFFGFKEENYSSGLGWLNSALLSAVIACKYLGVIQ